MTEYLLLLQGECIYMLASKILRNKKYLLLKKERKKERKKRERGEQSKTSDKFSAFLLQFSIFLYSILNGEGGPGGGQGGSRLSGPGCPFCYDAA